MTTSTQPDRAVSGSALGTRYSPLTVRRLGIAPYEQIWHKMQEFTATRTPTTPDEVWLLQHPPVYTLGIAGRTEHLPRHANAIPVLKVDRGGQVTYHGPGQLVLYALIDLRRMGIGVRALVRTLEQSVIDLLAEYAIHAQRRHGAPGVYVDDAKIAALGLRIRNGCSYHGLSFNVEMDLAPFSDIDPCGYAGLRVTQARDLGIRDSLDTLGENLLSSLRSKLESDLK
ncbi:MAG: lipoyl(octanoyl) transferase LipB [Burkholderiales bacterium]